MRTTVLDERLVTVRPHPRQIAHQRLEFYGFIHFTVNTFTDREWGDGAEEEAVFAPTALDADQWCRTAKDAGMQGLILTCKHHDGFCLWPSAYTEHSVKNSPFRGGKGDVVREFADACRRHGLKMGVYLSPWDRNSALYGQGKTYDDYFCAQLEELLTVYGEIFSVWFDGACGEGPNGRKQVYDWDRYYALIRRLQPNACISVCGPDVRWCGNEAGDTRESEWSVVPARTRDTERIKEASQQQDDAAFRQRKIQASDRDLGSRQVLAGEEELAWYPAEVNTSIRPGWFYHAAEDNQVRPLAELVHIYEHAVGGNATFLLNLPPDRRGLIHEADCRRCHELGEYIRNTYGRSLAEEAVISCAQSKDGHGAESLAQEQEGRYFTTEDGVTACEIFLSWDKEQQISRVVLKEDIRLSQRIEAFAIDALVDGGWQEVYAGTVVGYKKIAAIVLPESGAAAAAVTTRALHIRILDARIAPTLAFIGVY